MFLHYVVSIFAANLLGVLIMYHIYFQLTTTRIAVNHIKNKGFFQSILSLDKLGQSYFVQKVTLNIELLTV